MLGLVRIIATVWLVVGVLVVLGAALLAGLHFAGVASVLPIEVVGVVGGVGLVGLFVGWKVWDAAAGEGSRVQRVRMRARTARERAEHQGAVQKASAEVWRIIDEMIGSHRETLVAKRKELVRVDDYGKPVFDAWVGELDYFWERVVRPALVEKVSGEAYRAALQRAADWSGTPESRRSPDHAMREAVRARVEETLARPVVEVEAEGGAG